MALSAEEAKLRLTYDARPLNQFFKRVPFSMDTVARVANVASEGCFMTSLDDSSAFHHILIHPRRGPSWASRTAGWTASGASSRSGLALARGCATPSAGQKRHTFARWGL